MIIHGTDTGPQITYCDLIRKRGLVAMQRSEIYRD